MPIVVYLKHAMYLKLSLLIILSNKHFQRKNMRTRTLHHTRAVTGRLSTARKQILPFLNDSSNERMTVTTTLPDNTEKKPITITVVSSSIVWYDWG
jgi:hypothetical protein